ncbi:MAG: hypothetical protein KGY53_13140 [Wenzhouxiangellaceae bacterium]|nr:hypothetical protein [Wenzhouxiangellaceae bacterium]
MKSIRLCWATAVALLVAAPAQGHQPWVLTGDARLAPNQSTTDEVYFGHSFPGGELLAADRIATAAVVTPAGEFETVESGGRNPFESPPLARPGTYVIGIEQTSGYWTRTPKGGASALGTRRCGPLQFLDQWRRDFGEREGCRARPSS